MKICFICKYPPIEGGESSKAYWLLQGLGRRGHEIHVVTNAMEVESEYREEIKASDLEYLQPHGIVLHNTDPFITPRYIPYSKPYTEKLASIALEVIQQHQIDIIDSWYILPYGISGFIAKTLTGKPQILRHAGSDVSRLFDSPYLNTLFVELFKKVDKVVTYRRYKDFFSSLGVRETNIFYNTKLSVDTQIFCPSQPPFDLSQVTDINHKGLPVVSFIGKCGATKGIYELIEVLEEIKEDFLFVIVTGGIGVEKLRSRIYTSEISKKTILLNFVPPWKIPSLLRASTCVVHPERDFPVAAHSPILPREVMATGTCLILSKELYLKRISPKIIDGDSLLVVDPKDIPAFRATLESVIKNPALASEIGARARQISEEIEDFQSYLDSMESLYAEVMNIADKV